MRSLCFLFLWHLCAVSIVINGFLAILWLLFLSLAVCLSQCHKFFYNSFSTGSWSETFFLVKCYLTFWCQTAVACWRRSRVEFQHSVTTLSTWPIMSAPQSLLFVNIITCIVITIIVILQPFFIRCRREPFVWHIRLLSSKATYRLLREKYCSHCSVKDQIMSCV